MPRELCVVDYWWGGGGRKVAWRHWLLQNKARIVACSWYGWFPANKKYTEGVCTSSKWPPLITVQWWSEFRSNGNVTLHTINYKTSVLVTVCNDVDSEITGILKKDCILGSGSVALDLLGPYQFAVIAHHCFQASPRSFTAQNANACTWGYGRDGRGGLFVSHVRGWY